MCNPHPEQVEAWRSGKDIPNIEQRHKDAAAWAMDRAPDCLTWDRATASHVTPERRWQMNRVAEAMARMERQALASLANRPADDGEQVRAQDLADAKAWLCERWQQDHPNEQHIRQLADYAAYLRLPPQPKGVKR